MPGRRSPGSRMAVWGFATGDSTWEIPTLILLSLLLHFTSTHLTPVTEEDFSLLSETSENITCFSRTFKDLTCFWDEEDEDSINATYSFFYRYEEQEAEECSLSRQSVGGYGARYVCLFPAQDVRLFIDLFIEVLDTGTKVQKFSRELQVDTLGFINPPMNITAIWMGKTDHIRISWKAPLHEHSEFLNYQVLYFPDRAEDAQKLSIVRSRTVCDIDNLQPGSVYQIRLRTKPNEVSLNGIWGPWSQTITTMTSHSSDEIDLCCFTSDLLKVVCDWKWDKETADLSHELFYMYTNVIWQRCEERNKSESDPSLHSWNKNQSDPSLHSWNKNQSDPSLHSWKNSQSDILHSCAFWARNESRISVIVNITMASHLVVTYVKKSFLMHHIVLTGPPKVQKVEVTGSRLQIEWEPPLLEISEHLIYQIRYMQENGKEWKTLHIQHRANSEILDLTWGQHTNCRSEACQTGEYQGFWSPWSESIHVMVAAGTGECAAQ
ncbi:thrombopoietin receptor [Rhinatrema bivittatum]|uniref:thrombopoietin receptor n=1 Tax=Rhinatrema bivittatum TaxID=194408 RepID=UPI001127FEFA|nr:thrombopoietin receptor [Rhinatrema bivittatum]